MLLKTPRALGDDCLVVAGRDRGSWSVRQDDDMASVAGARGLGQIRGVTRPC